MNFLWPALVFLTALICMFGYLARRPSSLNALLTTLAAHHRPPPFIWESYVAVLASVVAVPLGGLLRASRGPLGGLLAPVGGLLETFWGPLGAILEATWKQLGEAWLARWQLGGNLANLSRQRAVLGLAWALLELLLGPSWRLLGPSWGRLGASRAPLEAVQRLS